MYKKSAQKSTKKVPENLYGQYFCYTFADGFGNRTRGGAFSLLIENVLTVLTSARAPL